MKLMGRYDTRLITAVSCAASILSLGVLLWIGLRFFNPWITLVAVTLMAVSPMDLAVARRAWQDEVLGCVVLVIVGLSCELGAGS